MRDQQLRLLLDAVQDWNLKNLVPILHGHLTPQPNVVRNRYREMFSPGRSGTDAYRQVNAVDVSTEVSEQMIVIQNIRGTHDRTGKIEHAGAPLPGGRPLLPPYLRSYNVEPVGLFTRVGSVVQISASLEKARVSDDSVTVKLGKAKISSKRAKKRRVYYCTLTEMTKRLSTCPLTFSLTVVAAAADLVRQAQVGMCLRYTNCHCMTTTNNACTLIRSS